MGRRLQFSLLLAALILSASVLPALGQEMSSAQVKAENALLKILEYVKNSAASARDLRSRIYFGELAAYVHIGLEDAESLEVLNSLAEKVSESVEREGEMWGEEEFPDELVKHLSLLDLLVKHYALTLSERSRENILKLMESLRLNLGWSPELMDAAPIAEASYLRMLMDADIPEKDLDLISQDLSANYMAVMNASASHGYAMLTSLRILSQYSAACRAMGSEPLIELEGLRKVLVNYTIEDLERVEVSAENYPLLLTYTDTLLTAYGAGGSPQVLEALTVIPKMMKLWRSGGRFLKIPFNPFLTHLFDPTSEPKKLFERAGQGEYVMKIDLMLPSQMALLAMFVKDLQPELSEKLFRISGEALEEVADSVLEKGFFDVGVGEHVGRLESAYFLSSWLLSFGAALKPPEKTSAYIPQRFPYVLTASTVILLALALAHKIERVKEGER